jgi:hypothetical protein
MTGADWRRVSKCPKCHGSKLFSVVGNHKVILRCLDCDHHVVGRNSAHCLKLWVHDKRPKSERRAYTDQVRRPFQQSF